MARISCGTLIGDIPPKLIDVMRVRYGRETNQWRHNHDQRKAERDAAVAEVAYLRSGGLNAPRADVAYRGSADRCVSRGTVRGHRRGSRQGVPLTHYRYKHAVEAMRWDGDVAPLESWHLDETGHPVRWITGQWTAGSPGDVPMVLMGDVYHSIANGQWLVWSDGEFLVMDDEQFRETYEEVK